MRVGFLVTVSVLALVATACKKAKAPGAQEVASSTPPSHAGTGTASSPALHPCSALADRLCADGPTELCNRTRALFSDQSGNPEECRRYLDSYQPGLWKVVVAGWPLPRDWSGFRLGMTEAEFMAEAAKKPVAGNVLGRYDSGLGCKELTTFRIWDYAPPVELLPDLPPEAREQMAKLLRPPSEAELDRALVAADTGGPAGLPVIEVVPTLPDRSASQAVPYRICWLDTDEYSVEASFVRDSLFALNVNFGHYALDAKIEVVVEKAIQKYGALWVPALFHHREKLGLAEGPMVDRYQGGVIRCDDRTAVMIVPIPADADSFDRHRLVLAALDIILDGLVLPERRHAAAEAERAKREQEARQRSVQF
jgi:hypothetical protein